MKNRSELLRIARASLRGLPLLLAVAVIFSTDAAAQDGQTVPTLDETIVTASRRAEPNRQISSTVQVIGEREIEKSPAHTVTELLADNAIGFLSEWTPGQTSINIRGAATDGQGKDFASQVLVLINGRRAGTANISKLSLADVKRIEIVRGPASVSYGSQAMGGVINIILRDGRNTEGGMAQAKSGSWGLAQGNAYYADKMGEFSYYLGGSGGRRDDYHTGKDCIECDSNNTAWTRRGGTLAMSYDPSPDHRFDVTARSDGHYKVGFRGSSADVDNNEDRYNQSLDLTYNGNTSNKRVKWTNHGYIVHDVDDLRWGSEAGGVNIDNNERRLDIWGLRNSVDVAVAQSNDLLAGIDLEQTTIRSFRHRITSAGVPGLLAPFDNNQRDRVGALFVEDVQRLFNDKVAIRGGARFTYGETTVLGTPGNVLVKESNENYDAVTYSAGISYLVVPEVKLRAGYATGFRAPTGTELAVDYTTVLGTQIVGNGNLTPESSEQFEVGISTQHSLLATDFALFQNVIKDRIKTVVVGPGNRSQYQNNKGDVVVQGIESQISFELGKAIGHANDWRVFGRGGYNFALQDHGSTKDSDRAERMYEYQAAIGTTYGKLGVWEIGALGILRGPMWYDTEETFVAGVESNNQHIHRKEPFWVINLHGLYRIQPGTALFGVPLPAGLEVSAHINNLLDKNEHPIFIALDKQPRTLTTNANGGAGNSMPGREYVVAMRYRF